MEYIIKYSELKASAHSHADEAWIARVWPSASGKTIYFNDRAMKRSQGKDSNHIDIETGDLYWISGVKKKGTNRRWGGSVYIEESLIPWYHEHTAGKCPAKLISMPDLRKPNIKKFHSIENEANG